MSLRLPARQHFLRQGKLEKPFYFTGVPPCGALKFFGTGKDKYIGLPNAAGMHDCRQARAAVMSKNCRFETSPARCRTRERIPPGAAITMDDPPSLGHYAGKRAFS